ncbi:MAG: response regulator [Nitrospira sp.]|nr:response regulator [Nitrospira sp.]MBP6605645.1 response regulator [Nitrospira sp.]HQY58553.1 response regulator [Nitrospira sp.]HRA98361.1 response regulator [Nitrospira sp.]
MAHRLRYFVLMVTYSEGSRAEGPTPAVLLVVEDDKDMRSLLCDELWGEGYHLREASNGEEGLAAVMRAAPDLIVTDLKMPDGGFEYVHRLRRCVPECPIIVMTAFGDAQTKDEALKNGATAYFDKPVRLSELKATVKQLLQHPGGRPADGLVH